jgi:hypothetical protein
MSKNCPSALRKNFLRRGILLVATALVAIVPAGAAAVNRQEISPWNGEWVLSPTRNTKAVREAAAEGYRFHISNQGSIRWEIPTIHEIVQGRIDGQPMPIVRRGSKGMTLAVTAEGERVLRYVVSKDGKPLGEGRMTLVEEGRAWVDITQPFGRPELAHVVIYERPPTRHKST